MANVNFIDDIDKTTFYPFELIDARNTEWRNVRLSFSDWDWFKKTHKSDTIDGYYMNGYGIQGLVLASRIAAGLEAYADCMEPNSEGDSCYIMFEDSDLETAIETARLAHAMINDRDLLEKMIVIARDNDLED